MKLPGFGVIANCNPHLVFRNNAVVVGVQGVEQRNCLGGVYLWVPQHALTCPISMVKHSLLPFFLSVCLHAHAAHVSTVCVPLAIERARGRALHTRAQKRGAQITESNLLLESRHHQWIAPHVWGEFQRHGLLKVLGYWFGVSLSLCTKAKSAAVLPRVQRRTSSTQ